MSVKSGYLSNLTPLRGLAAILVAVFHFEMAIGRFVPAATTMFFEKSYLMVDLFFVLSGFIMLHVYGQAFERALRGEQVRHFFVAVGGDRPLSDQLGEPADRAGAATGYSPECLSVAGVWCLSHL